MSAQLNLEDAYEDKPAQGRALPTEQAIESILERFHSTDTAVSVGV